MPLKPYKRGDAWHVRGTVAGKRIRESTGCDTRAQAVAWAIRRECEIIDRHAYGHRATLTFAQAALTYIEAGGEPGFWAAF